MNNEEAAAQVFGYDVTDGSGNKIGKVDNVWVDDATSELEFVGVKTGWLMGKTHVIPVANAQIGDNSIQVPFDEDQIKGAPSFDGDAELSPEQEDEIYGYYGEDRSTDTSPTGLPADDADDDAANTYATADNAASDNTDSDDDGLDDSDGSVTLHEESLNVQKQQVETGRVRLRKVVHTEHQEVPVDLRREEVQIERVPAGEVTDGDGAFQEQVIEVPVTREEAVVETEAHPTEQVRLNKTTATDIENVGGDVRREDVVTDGPDYTADADADTATTTSDYDPAGASGTRGAGE
jgi:uncharacterized protein (TIGR02271 family)